MKGRMMHYPLTLTRFIERAGTLFGEKGVVSVLEGGSVRHDWAEVLERVRRLVSALRGLGVRPGDRVATLAWNTHRHLEAYFAVPAAGAVLHTVNVRLSPAQIAYILRDGGARVLLADTDTIDLIDVDAFRASGGEHLVAMGGVAPAGWLAYEGLLAAGDPDCPFTEVEEDAACGLCYTSGTTGEPKGVVYSHRALALHSLGICLPDGFGLGEADVILPAVPMFHANAWGLVHAAAMTGAGLILPGVRPHADVIAGLLESERVTFAAGVPTVWMGVLDALRANRRALAPRLRIHSGGAPSAPALIEAYRREFAVEVITGWGMTELSPVGMVTHPRADMATASDSELLRVRTSQGTPLPMLEARIVGESGAVVAHDGDTPGELEVRGAWVTAGYYGLSTPESFRDGWLRTGDVATIDPRGYVRLVDRTKDLIRSGGEWISSVRLEHALMGHPAVAEAVVVAMPDPKWQERPVACVVLRQGAVVSEGDLFAILADAFPKWWVPDKAVFLDALPLTSTGKFDKRKLRAQFMRGE